jgi:hypothetical protein
MGESIVQVTEGSGKKLHTWQRTIGANSVEDEYVLLGENALASYTMTDDARSTATANSHLWQIMAGASLKVRVRRIEIFQSVMATTAALAELRLYRVTTAGTGGGATGFIPLDPSDAASGATGMTLPTVKGTEGNLIAVAKPYMMQTIGASAQLQSPSVVWDFDRPRSKPLIIAAGTTNGIVIKNVTAIAGASLGVLVWIDETSFT